MSGPSSSSTFNNNPPHQRVALTFAQAEWWLIGLVVAVLIAGLVSASLHDKTVDWPAFAPPIAASFAMILMGGYVRASKAMTRMALGSIGFGLFTCFSSSIAIFIYTLFPLAHPLVDLTLIRLDAAFGFVWLDFVEQVAGFPLFGVLLRYIYLSILPQVAIVIILLAYLNRPGDLHKFLAVGIVGMVVTVCFWWLLPSVGPSAFGMVSTDVQATIRLLANAAYGAEMQRLATQGIDVITPLQIKGVVAFPSFHMVMACMVVWFSRRTGLFLPAVCVNLLMLPATIVHGGHHLVDLVGGLTLFAGCLWLVGRVVPASDRQQA